MPLCSGDHATTYRGLGVGAQGGWAGEGGPPAVAQGLLSFQCFSVVAVSLTSHHPAAALTCFLNTHIHTRTHAHTNTHFLSLSSPSFQQGGRWTTAISVTLTHDEVLHVYSTGFGGEGGNQRLPVLDSRPTIDAVGSACISSKLCFFCWWFFFLDLLCVPCVTPKASRS